jgi:hypothetical protein
MMPDRCDEHLAQEAELPVPDDRDRREHGGEQRRGGEDAWEHEGLEVERAGGPARERAQAGAQHEQEQQRLDERRHEAGAVLQRPDQVALQHDLHGPQVERDGAPRDPDRGDGRHRRAIAANIAGMPGACSESRIVRPV